MEVALDSDIYEPCIDDNNNYIDYCPPGHKFKNGLRCPCGSRQNHVFYNRSYFIAKHIKSDTHQKWLTDLNTNKGNFYVECQKMKDEIVTLKTIIAKQEKDNNLLKSQIVYLNNKLMIKDGEGDLINFMD